MAQGPQQFTPQQILEAGRRAEGEGRIEYAIQFYRHLTDHLARTPEAATAREYLARLGASGGPGAGASPSTANINGHYQAAMPAPGTLAGGMQSTNGHTIGSPQATGAAIPAGMAMPVRPPGGHPGSGALVVRSGPAPAAAAESAARRKLVPPKSRRRYRTGRFVAKAFTVLGFVEIIIGLMMIGAGLFAKGPASGVSALPDFLAAQQQLIGASLGITIILFGLTQVMGGQLARAIFDTASANRDLAAYARARALYEAGTVDEHPAQD